MNGLNEHHGHLLTRVVVTPGVIFGLVLLVPLFRHAQSISGAVVDRAIADDRHCADLPFETETQP